MKYHYLVHIALLSDRLNPALGWCYGGESFLKHVKRMVGQAAHGTKLEKVGDKVIDAYLRGVHMLLTSGVLVKRAHSNEFMVYVLLNIRLMQKNDLPCACIAYTN